MFADEWSQESAEALREATATLKGRADVIGADIKEAARAASFFGVEEMAMPVMTAHAPRTNAKYVEKADAVDASAIIAFGEAVVAGTLEPYVKSEPVPTSDDGPVKVVVAKTFDEVVMSGRDVMIEFYAPWCGHCQRLAPTYEELAQWAHASTNVLVAKMDATANDVVNPKFDVKGFPTIYFVQGESGRVLPYEGERTLEALKDFILDNASTFDEL